VKRASEVKRVAAAKGWWLVLLLGLAAPPLAAAEPAAGSILFMTSHEWRGATGAQKRALAADFMRIFCAQPTMPPASLSDCLDRASAGSTLFDSALACVRASAERR
jgi:hypothetical protein